MSQIITLQMRRRTPAQKRISQSLKRFNIAVWSRQSGKTTYGLDKCIDRPLCGRPDGIYWNILQTNSAAEVAFNRYWKLFDGSRELLKKKPHETDKCFTLANGAKVFFKSGEVLQNLRDETLDGVVIDEYRQQDKRLWSEVIRPMLARRKGWADILTTPNGFDHSYDLWNFALEHPDEWGAFHAPATECWWWTTDEIASAMASMSEGEFAQEILAEFRDLGTGKAYLNAGPDNWRETNPFCSTGLLSPHLPIVIGLDFNVGLMAWTLAQTHLGEWYFFDEIAIKNTNTQEAVPVLIDKIRGHKPGVILVGDATGNARKTSAAGNTDYSIIMEALKGANITFQNKTPDSNPLVKDRVNTMNSKLKDANGNVHLWVHPKNCPYLKKDLERVVWKENANGAILDQVRDRLLTHASDAAGYPVHAMTDPWKVSPGVTRVIRR